MRIREKRAIEVEEQLLKRLWCSGDIIGLVNVDKAVCEQLAGDIHKVVTILWNRPQFFNSYPASMSSFKVGITVV